MHKFLSLILAAAIIYVVIDSKKAITTGYAPKATLKESFNADEVKIVKENETSKEVTENLKGGIIEQSISKILINTIKTPQGSALFQKIVSPHQEVLSHSGDSFNLNKFFKLKIVSEGSGNIVSCGHVVVASYQIHNSDKKLIDSGSKRIILGDNNVPFGLSNVIVGMKVGEYRTATVPEAYLYENPAYKGKKPEAPTAYYDIDVRLISAMPNNFTDNNVKIFDKASHNTVPLLCGNHVTFDAKILKTNGEVIFDSTKSKKINMHIGDSSYPMIFSHALFNMSANNERSVICKGKHLRSLLSKKQSKIFSIEENQPDINEFFIVEILNAKFIK